MTAVLWLLALVAMALGLLGIVLPLLPGTPLLFAGMLLAAWLDDFSRVGVVTVVALGVLATAAWLIEYLAAAWGVKRVGASSWAVAGATIGAVLGIFGGLPGLVIGPIVGAVVGEYLARRDGRTAAKAGAAAGVGFIVAVVAKLALGATMVAVFAYAYFT